MDSELPIPTAPEPQVAPDPPLFKLQVRNKVQMAFAALLRLVLYIALVWVLWTIKNVFLELLFRAPYLLGSPLLILLEELLGFAVVYGAAVILSRIEHRPVGAYGLPLSGNWAIRFAQGCVFGLCEISALIALIAIFGGYSFGSMAIHDLAILRWASEWAVIFLIVGLFEEFAFRGYTLYTLAQGVGYWPAAILLALYFGFEHSHNPGESLAGEAGVALIALLFAFTLRRTGTLWLAVGWHAAFDFGETFLYSVPDSGAVFPGHLSNASLHGPDWLTGGATGPEGSVFSFAVMAVLAVVFHFLYPRQPLLPALPSAAPQSSLDPK